MTAIRRLWTQFHYFHSSRMEYGYEHVLRFRDLEPSNVQILNNVRCGAYVWSNEHFRWTADSHLPYTYVLRILGKCSNRVPCTAFLFSVHWIISNPNYPKMTVYNQGQNVNIKMNSSIFNFYTIFYTYMHILQIYIYIV